MKQVLTAKLKLLPTSEQFQALRQTQLAYRDALPLRLAVLVCAWQEEQPAVVATRVLRRNSCAVWASRPNGLQRSPPGGSHLQGLVDEGQAERKGAKDGPRSATKGWSRLPITSPRR